MRHCEQVRRTSRQCAVRLWGGGNTAPHLAAVPQAAAVAHVIVRQQLAVAGEGVDVGGALGQPRAAPAGAPRPPGPIVAALLGAAPRQVRRV